MIANSLSSIYNKIIMNSIFAFLPSLGGPELVIIFVAVLVLFGAKKLPEFAKGLGKSMGEFKKARQDFESEITRAEEEVSLKPEKSEEKETKA